MRFPFIADGNAWQEFVSRLLTADSDEPRSRCRGFEPLSSDRLGDYGLDGLACGSGTSRTGTVFQMYFPLWEPGEPLHARVNKKLTETCSKLRRNADSIRALTGMEITRLVLIIPEDQDVKVRAHKARLETETGLKIEIWGRTKVAKFLSKHTNAVRDLLPFPVEAHDVKALLREGVKLQSRGQIAAASEYYAKAEFYALLHNDNRSLCSAKSKQAELAYDVGDVQRARVFASDALALVRSYHTKALPTMLLSSGQIEAAAGEHRAAEKLLREAIRCARMQRKADLVPVIKLFQADVAMSQANTARAKRLLAQCFAACCEKGGTDLVNALWFRARLAMQEGDMSGAVPIMRDAVHAAEMHRAEPQIVGRFAEALADLLYRQRCFDEALTMLVKAQKCFADAGQTINHLRARIATARTLIAADRVQDATTLLPALLELCRQQEVSSLVGEAHFVCAEAALGSGEWRDALTHGDAACSQFALEGSTPGLVRTLLLMGQAAEAAAQTTDTDGMLHRAEELRARAVCELEQGGPSVPAGIVVDARLALAHSQELIGHFEEAIVVLEATTPESLQNPDHKIQAREMIERGLAVNREKARAGMGRQSRLKREERRERSIARAKHGTKQVADLNRQMFRLVDSFPKAGNELIDFHFKDRFEAYLSALHETSGRKLFIAANDGAEMTAALRRLVLLADIMIFAVRKYEVQPGTSVFPLQDRVASEVLGLALGMDATTGQHFIQTPAQAALVTNLLLIHAADSGKPETILGVKWDGREFSWGRSFFNRTSQEFVNDRGEACHITVGLTHTWHVMEDGLIQSAKDLLTSGHAVFAPFIRTSADAAGTDESLLKAGLFDATVAVQDGRIWSEGTVHPLSEVKVPYLEDVPLPLLCKIVEDEGESLRAFRIQLDRALEDIRDSGDPADVRKEIKKLQRNLLEDELDRVRQVCERVSRMNALTRIGAYVATGALTIAGVMGLSAPAIVCGASGAATATVAELYRNYEEKRKLRRSPMYFLWRLESRAG